MPLDPCDYDAQLGYGEDGWVGIAEMIDDSAPRFRVRRLASREHAEQVCAGQEVVVWIAGSSLDSTQGRPRIVAPGTPGARCRAVEPYVASRGPGVGWVFSATGWVVPI